MSERRFAKGDSVRMVNAESVFYGETGTVFALLEDDPYHYWVRVGKEFADILPFKDEELEMDDD